MLPNRKRVKPGDVLELKAADRYAYLQFIGRHPEYGDAILVGPKLYASPHTEVTGEAFLNGYVTFYPVTVAVARGLVEVVGHLTPPSLPQRFRRPGAMSGRRIDTWVIEDNAGEVVRRKLSEAELQLPIASIWNHELLVQRITEGWTPTQEGRRS